MSHQRDDVAKQTNAYAMKGPDRHKWVLAPKPPVENGPVQMLPLRPCPGIPKGGLARGLSPIRLLVEAALLYKKEIHPSVCVCEDCVCQCIDLSPLELMIKKELFLYLGNNFQFISTYVTCSIS